MFERHEAPTPTRSTGSPTDGCCYSVSRPSTGHYNITFAYPFAGTPSVTATPYNYFENTAVGVIQPTANGVSIGVRNASGTLINWGFNFCIIGPR